MSEQYDDPDVGLLPLSAAQRGMWFAEKLSDGYSVNTAQYFELRHEPGGLDIDLFMACCVHVGKTMETPYARLVEIDGIPMQRVDLEFDQHMQLVDFRDSDDPRGLAMEWMLAEYRRPLDLVNDELIASAVLRIDDTCTLWYTRAHHIILDGYAAMAMSQQAFTRYNALRRGEVPADKPSASLEEIVAYEDAYQHSSRKQTDREHWAGRVADLPERATLAHGAVPAPLSFQNVLVSNELPAAQQARLAELARETNSSIAVLLTAAFGAFLARMNGADDVVLTLPVAARTTAKIKRSGGMVSNAVPIRLRRVLHGTVRDVVDAALLELTGALRHQRYRSEDIHRDAGLAGGSTTFGPSINMVFFDDQIHVDGAEISYRILSSGILEDLLINLYQASASSPVVVDLHGNPHAYTREELTLHHRRFIQFVSRFIDDLDAAVSDVDLFLQGERDVVDAQSGVDEVVTATANAGSSLVDLFARSVAEHADNTAVSDGTRTIDYASLDARSDAVAAGLAASGVLPGDLVAVATDRSVDLVTSILGVMKAGAAYLPLDTTNPADRLQFIVADAMPSAAIVDDTTRQLDLWLSVPPQVGVHTVADLADRGAGIDFSHVDTPADGRAYVIYTSGSTGRPKGVEVTHRDVVTLMDTAANDFEFRSDDVWTMFHSYAFDFSVWELWGPLLTGGRLHVVDRLLARDPSSFVRLCADEGVTVLSQTPSAFYQFAEARRHDRGSRLALRYIVFGGEELNFEYVRRWFDDYPAGTPSREGQGPVLVNMYGITETTVHVTFRELDPASVRADDASFVGRPLASLGLLILDSRLRPVPAGVVGEMYVTGGQLAQGYLNRPGLSSERFVANPFGPSGSRMYRTGDLARRTGDDIAYLGRRDSQVQLRGYRIEYGEIEAALLSLDGVAGAAASVVDLATRGEQLVGYVVLESDAELDVQAARSVVGRAVPGYMVPDLVVAVDELPLTANGKLDRKALPAPELGDVQDEYVEPADDHEAAVAAVFADVLGLDRVGVTTGFFDLGGNSLSATRLASRVSAVLDSAVSVRDVFEAPTVRALVAATAGNGPAVPPVTAVTPRPDIIPLSYPQTRLWILNRIDPGTAAYNIPGAAHLPADTDVDAMRRAIGDVVRRHEALRTVFPLRDEEPIQDVRSVEEAVESGVVQVIDVAEDALTEAVTRISSAGFDLEHELPARFQLLRVRDDNEQVTSFVLVAVVHHIAGDGASIAPLIRDVMYAYGANVRGTEPEWSVLPVQYADFTLWQRDVLGDPSDPASLIRRQIDFWSAELDGLPELAALPIDRPRPSQQSGVGDRFDVWLDADTSEALRTIATSQGVTLFTVFQAITATVIARLTDSTDVALGTAVLGRDDPRLADLVGMFVNTVVLRHRIDETTDFGTLLNDAHRIRARALGNADVSFEQVVDALDVPRSTDHSPLFQVELAMQQDEVTSLVTGGDDVGLIDARTSAVKYDLSLAVTEFGPDGVRPHAVSVEFAYATDLFDEATVVRIADYFLRIVGDVVDGGAATSMSTLLQFTDAELVQVSEYALGETVDVPESTLADEIARQIAATPNAVALESIDARLTYAEFGARVNTLARRLIARGVGPDVAVGVAVPRSIDMYVAIHAVVAAGGQYVPLDAGAPADRIAYMVETSGARLVLVGAEAVSLPSAGVDTITVTAESLADVTVADAQSTPITDADRLAALHPSGAAYTLFTSGSTGRPKGVTVAHSAIVNRLAWAQSEHRFTADDVVLHKTPITFDVSVWELFWPLMTGASVTIADPGRHGDPQYLSNLIDDGDVTVAHFVPSMLAAFADVLGDAGLGALSSMRLIVTSGEALTPAVAQRVVRVLPGVELANLYGPTEAAVDVTWHPVVRGEAVVPIGRPVWNTQTRVLDENLRPVPQGVPGELYLGGVQLARGYAARGALTAERFIADPFSDSGGRLYRTGDMARWNNSGELEYMGRNDFQVKLRGQRLELGEIEAVLASTPGVVHAVATVAAIGGGDHLVGYYAPDTVPTDELRAVAEKALPDYMRPTVWMPLAAMPLGSAGKADRRALPAPALVSHGHVDARTDTEKILAEVFADVLGVEPVSVVESFFDLGGNSLSATKVAARASGRLGRKIPVAVVFESPSVAALAAAVDGLPDAELRPALSGRPHGGRGPLSATQRGMWLVNRADPDSAVANVAMALDVQGELDVPAMRAAVRDLLDRHESLRTRYPFVDGDARQEVLATAEAYSTLEFVEQTIDGDVDQAIGHITGRGFDVSAAPPVRFTILESGPTSHVLVVVVHHVAIDGASLLPLARDVMVAYDARARGTRPDWAPPAVQYLDYATWQNDWLASVHGGRSQEQIQLDYWAERLSGAPTELFLPTDRPRPKSPSFHGADVRFELAADVVERIESVARAHHATPFMVLQSAFAVLLSRLTTQRDVVIGTPVAGRGDRALDDVIGMFVNTLALRTQVNDEEKFSEMLSRVRTEDLADMGRSDVPFDAVASRVVPTPSASYNPVYQVLFAYQNFYFPTLELAGLTVSPVSEQVLPAKADLQLTLFPSPPGSESGVPMGGQFLYATDLFDEATVQTFAERFVAVVEQIADNAQIRVADISILTESENQPVEDEPAVQEALPDLVERASAAAPSAEAVTHDGISVTFESLGAMTAVMAAALPDRDSALTTALMSLLPTVAPAGPEVFGTVLENLRRNAESVTESITVGTRERSDHT
ncbi:amino acid adenylation domain-containing protein [Gordonia sp. (in: high G+C Gram-positive bacteria)]|uniref:amino acid adenylation domain-containing protein n=1 Tax=Gordonia sp. (in: high G+C Gram-positive bacteria) TaxID=84139 RepID=UPI00333EFA78